MDPIHVSRKRTWFRGCGITGSSIGRSQRGLAYICGVVSVCRSLMRRSDTMKEVLGLFGLAIIFFAIAYFIGLPTV